MSLISLLSTASTCVCVCVCAFDMFYIQLVYLLYGSMEFLRTQKNKNKYESVLNSIEILHNTILQFNFFY